MNKFCAFGAMTPWRFGEVLEIDGHIIKIKPEHGAIEYWDKPWVEIFDTKEEALNETKKWIWDEDR